MPQYRPTRWPSVFYRGEVLYFRIRNESGRRVTVRYGVGSPRDASRAQQLAQERADAIRRGVLDPRAEQLAEAGRRPITEAIADYIQHLRDKGDDHRHVKVIESYLTRWAAACSIGCLLDAKAQGLVRWLADQDWSARSHNAARAAVLALCRWAVDYGHVAYNPIPAGLVAREDEQADRKRVSRALTMDELGRLLDAAGRSRGTFYLLAAFTGLRWREIARLRWSDIDLDAGVVTAQAGQTKNGKAATLPLASILVASLSGLRRHGTHDRLFTAEPRLRTWKHDLAKAKIQYEVNGRIADRKCLRLTFGTMLRRAGVDLRDAQRLMRHSDPALTANVYTDLRLSDLRAAVEGLGKRDEPEQRNERMA